MPGIMGKRFPGMIWKPSWPFLGAAFVVMYGVNSFAEVMKTTEPYNSDPRNPNYKGPPAAKGEH